MGVIPKQPIEFADAPPRYAEGTAVVDATPEQIWAVLIDHATWPSWFGKALKSVVPTSEPAAGVGSTRTVSLQGGTVVEEEFIAWDEPRLWAFTGTKVSPPAFRKLVERCTIEPLDDGHTRITYRMAFEPAPLIKPLAGMIAKTASKALGDAMANLGAEASRRAAAG